MSRRLWWLNKTRGLRWYQQANSFEKYISLKLSHFGYAKYSCRSQQEQQNSHSSSVLLLQCCEFIFFFFKLSVQQKLLVNFLSFLKINSIMKTEFMKELHSSATQSCFNLFELLVGFLFFLASVFMSSWLFTDDSEAKISLASRQQY